MSVPGRRQGLSSSGKSENSGLAIDFLEHRIVNQDRPASISISVIGFPFASYTGLASISIVEVLIPGYDDPNRDAPALLGGSALTVCGGRDFELVAGEAVLLGSFFIAFTR